MARLELFDFQQEVADKLVESAIDYFQNGPDTLDNRPLPFVGQLKAVTGSGKTPILCSVMGRLHPSIILWTTKFGSVVDQTVTNLAAGGKYNHLFGLRNVEVMKFGDIPSAGAWRHILERTDGVTILVSTVAAWNSSEKDERLNVHKEHNDWGDKSRWDQLKIERNRPLWIVYDEAHNTTTEQIELLVDLEPSGFFVASASPLKGKLLSYVANLSEETRKKRIVSVSTRAVVDAQLLKSTISLADYESSTDEMLKDTVNRWRALEQRFLVNGIHMTPKAIYVVETSNAMEISTEARPIAIWKSLVNNCNIDPATIAVCTNTKNLPDNAVRVESINKLSDQYTHIIFNKKLQEGWDDPAVCVCYFDGRTYSATRLQQVLGRALRQPNAVHLHDEELNTAYFFVNCPNELLETLIDGLKEELYIYKDGDDDKGFEPVKIKEEHKAPPKIGIKEEWKEKLKVPWLQLEIPTEDNPLQDLVERKTYDFGEGDCAAPGRATINIVATRTGEFTQNTRNLLEDMRVPCGWYLREQIRSRSRNCLNSMHPHIFTSEKLKKTACYRSKALEHYKEVAAEVVQAYENHVQLLLREKFDPSDSYYEVGEYQPTSLINRDFENAGHPYYDNKAFANDDEFALAKALDKFPEYAWVRNKARLDYGIPLPIKSDSSSTFYPDFLWWVKNTIWAIDPTGGFILKEKIRTKLLNVPVPIKIALITHKKYDPDFNEEAGEGWTLVSYRRSNPSPEVFYSLDRLLRSLIAESEQQ